MSKVSQIDGRACEKRGLAVERGLEGILEFPRACSSPLQFFRYFAGRVDRHLPALEHTTLHRAKSYSWRIRFHFKISSTLKSFSTPRCTRPVDSPDDPIGFSSLSSPLDLEFARPPRRDFSHQSFRDADRYGRHWCSKYASYAWENEAPGEGEG